MLTYLYRAFFPRHPLGRRNQERRTLYWVVIGTIVFCFILGVALYTMNKQGRI